MSQAQVTRKQTYAYLILMLIVTRNEQELLTSELVVFGLIGRIGGRGGRHGRPERPSSAWLAVMGGQGGRHWPGWLSWAARAAVNGLVGHLRSGWPSLAWLAIWAGLAI